MAVSFDPMLDACYAQFGEEATYTPPAGSPAAFSAIAQQPTLVDAGLSRAGFVAPTLVLTARKSELATPVRGGAVTFAATAYVVAADPRLCALGKEWTLDLEPA